MSQVASNQGHYDVNSTSWSRQQNQNVLIAGLTCACFSVLATLISLRWFILMKRNFRHKLIMFLIFSDTFKAFWYFIYPVVVFSRGPVTTSSAFCQASGFFLSIGIEASDFAILMIALHAILYIFRPPARSGDEGGLYKYRKFMYACWICLPILAASLAFVHDGRGYATAGTFCYLPRRPIWYRLALAWIPRYFIICLIFSMYAAVYIYVTLKFRSFSHLQDSDGEFTSSAHSRRSSMSQDEIAPDEPTPPPSATEPPKKSKGYRPTFSRNASFEKRNSQPVQEMNPWDEVSFITSRGLKTTSPWQKGVDSSDFAMNGDVFNHSNGDASNRASIPAARVGSSAPGSRKPSNTGTTNSRSTEMSNTPSQRQPTARHISQAVQKLSERPQPRSKQDPLRRTRRAIRKQLRYLFIYPAVYVVMWAFPFASQCLLYDDYYVENPIYWLTVVSTCMFSLQAGADCVVFSWREKPWKRIPESRKFSLDTFRPSFSARRSVEDRTAQSSVAPDPESLEHMGNGFASGPSSRATSNALWWEAEGKKRKDSVWMGTDGTAFGERRDTLAPIESRSEEEATAEAQGSQAMHYEGAPEVGLESVPEDRSVSGEDLRDR